jgi:hypothetical protein
MLRGCGASHLDQSFASHFLEQFEQVALALFRINVILLHHGIAKLPDSLWLLQKVPHGRANRVHSIVDAVLHVQDGCFVAKSAEHLVLGRDYDRMDGNCGIHLELEPSCRVDPPAEYNLSFCETWESARPLKRFTTNREHSTGTGIEQQSLPVRARPRNWILCGNFGYKRA